MNKDLISIIIPVFNVERYIERCLRSILGQIYTNIELILVDDGSTDRSGMICDEYALRDYRIKVFHKLNGGQSSARNMGLDHVHGKYIGFVDSDDYILPEMYAYLHRLLVENKADIANLKCMKVFGEDVTGIINSEKDEIQTYFGKACLRNLLYEGTVGVLATYGVYRGLYKRELFENVRFVEGRINEDIVLSYQLYERAEKLVVSNRIGYFYYHSKNSTTRNILRKKDFDLLWACNKLNEFSQKETDADIRYLISIKNARSYFSLLAKIAYFGIDVQELERKETIRLLLNKLRDNYSLLMKSPISINRKIMISMLCVHINLLSWPLWVYRKLTHQ